MKIITKFGFMSLLLGITFAGNVSAVNSTFKNIDSLRGKWTFDSYQTDNLNFVLEDSKIGIGVEFDNSETISFFLKCNDGNILRTEAEALIDDNKIKINQDYKSLECNGENNFSLTEGKAGNEINYLIIDDKLQFNIDNSKIIFIKVNE